MAGPGSRDIADYFEARLIDIRPGVELPVDIHLYFALNRHLMVWKKKGEKPNTEFIDRYESRGIHRIWIHKDEKETFERYLAEAEMADSPAPLPQAPAEPSAQAAPEVAQAAAPQTETVPPSPSNDAEAAPAVQERRTEQGALIAAVLASPELTKEQKKAIVSEAARAVLEELTSAETREEQIKADKKAWQTIQDVLDGIADHTAAMVSDVWKLARIDPDLEHAVNVSTYSVIFAMTFGKIESDLISDLALAGLLHDVGMSQIPADLAVIPTKQLKDEMLGAYAEHVSTGLMILAAHSGELPARVKTVILQHHEKFDGTGYPARLSGFKVDDVTQLVAMADLLHSMSSGHWDGQERTLKDSFETLERLEKARTFPEYFNPDIYTAVIGWIRNAATQDLSGKASQVVLKQVREVIDKT